MGSSREPKEETPDMLPAGRQIRVVQQEVVFPIFAVAFIVIAARLPEFHTADNVLALPWIAAVLGIVGLVVAIIVRGRDTDVSGARFSVADAAAQASATTVGNTTGRS